MKSPATNCDKDIHYHVSQRLGFRYCPDCGQQLLGLCPSESTAFPEIPNHQNTMTKKPVATDKLNEARRDMSDVVEEIGAACLHLREAMDFAEKGSMPSAILSVDDALAAIDNAIEEIHKVRNRAGLWAVWADGLDSQTH